MYEDLAYALVISYDNENTCFAIEQEKDRDIGWGLRRRDWYSGKRLKPTDLAAGRAILEADLPVQAAVVMLILTDPHIQNMLDWHYAVQHNPHKLSNASNAGDGLQVLLDQLCKRKLPYTTEQVLRIVQLIEERDTIDQVLLRIIARALLTEPALLGLCRTSLERVRKRANLYGLAQSHPYLKLLDEILLPGEARSVVIQTDDWGALIAEPTAAMITDDLSEYWLALLRHCIYTKGSAPEEEWLKEVPGLRQALGEEIFLSLALLWLDAFGGKRGQRLQEDNANLLRGLAWCCSDMEEKRLAISLADAAIEGYRKIPRLGPRSPRVASACVFALKRMPGSYAVAQLERARLNVRQPGYLEEINKALDEAARRAGMSREDLVEMTVPTFNLRDGLLQVEVGTATAEIRLSGRKAVVQWFDGAGEPCKAVPAVVKRDHKDEFKAFKRLSDNLTSMLSAQCDRLEQLPLLEQTWAVADWRERYLDHPLISHLARHLIWRFVDGEHTLEGIWLDGQLVDAENRPLELSATTTVAAWHPIFSHMIAIQGWRAWLERHQITQPFKQAYREIYLLTDAERNTRIYSQRFAAHFLRQHQFLALSAARGWRNHIRMMVDDSYTPAILEIPRWGLRAEFWVEGAGDRYGVDTNGAGVFLYVATNQVRFHRLGAAHNRASAFAAAASDGGGYHSIADDTLDPNPIHAPVPLEEIPPLIFSEVMRDVDLFVGVTSIGNDPVWREGAPLLDEPRQNHYQAYWNAYSVGELSPIGETRRDLLARLLPRLAIADRCTLQDRFLRVQGEVRSYRIHLGSGNILMEPDDQYLCIVPGGDADETDTTALMLPFEGDTMLSIILSKAFLLAEDAKITDLTITRQLFQHVG